MLNKNMPGIGIDADSIQRFRALTRGNTHRLQKLFTPREIAYCTKHTDAAVHFAGIFVAKEAASKALGVSKNHYLSLEVRHTNDGAPEIWKNGRKARVAISITHTDTLAIAFALAR